MSRERLTIAATLRLLRTAFPLREPGTNFAYASERDKRGKWREVTWWILCASASGRFTVHPVVFQKPDYNFSEWADFMGSTASGIVEDRVLAALNRATGDDWKVVRPICWVRGERSRSVYRTSELADRAARRSERAFEAKGGRR